METVSFWQVFADVCHDLPGAVAEFAVEYHVDEPLKVEIRSRNQGLATVYHGDRVFLTLSRRSDERQTIRVKPKFGGQSQREFLVTDTTVGRDVLEHMLSLLERRFAPPHPRRVPRGKGKLLRPQSAERE